MPSTTVTSEDNGIFRTKDGGGQHRQRESVSNFGVEVVASVNVSSEAGGPGLLLKIKRYPDNVEKMIFSPMSEVSGTVKQFLILLNQQFPGGALFLLLSDLEFRKMMMDMTKEMMEGDGHQTLYAARLIGRNHIDNRDQHSESFWVMSEDLQLNSDGVLVQDTSPFMWLRRLVNGSNILLQESLACKVATPLDNGHCLTQLCVAIQQFMPENFLPAMATLSASIMGATYTTVLAVFGCCGVPIAVGPPGSCKSEAARCALSLYGAHETHSRNNQTTPSYLFNAASKTTIPICIDDVNEKSAESWEELIIDAYNGTGRGTRMYGVEVFRTLPILTANWKLSKDRPRAHSRVIQIPFQQHEDEPEANHLFEEMASCRDNASKSLGILVRLSQKFEEPQTKEHISRNISPSVAKILAQIGAPARFTTTMSIFMHFFLELSKIAGAKRTPSGEDLPLLCEEDCWSFFAHCMAPLTVEEGSADKCENDTATLHNDPDLHLLSFVETVAQAIQEVDTCKALQMVSLDVNTTCHLGVCIAIRHTIAIPLISTMSCVSLGVERFNKTALENTVKLSDMSKLSKQHFLKPSSKDDCIKRSVKGTGGNTSPYTCLVVKQSAVPEDVMDLLYKGISIRKETPQDTLLDPAEPTADTNIIMTGSEAGDKGPHLPDEPGHCYQSGPPTEHCHSDDTLIAESPALSIVEDSSCNSSLHLVTPSSSCYAPSPERDGACHSREPSSSPKRRKE